MRIVSSSVLMAALLIGPWAGCSDDAETDPDAACQKMAAASCGKSNSCAPTYVQLLYGDVATCTTRIKSACLTAMQAPGTSVTPAVASSCADAYSSRACDALLDPAPPQACRPSPGTLADGTACATDNQCQGAYCKMNGKCGVCSKRAAAGSACESSSDCDFDLTCVNKACVTYVSTAGGACDQTKPCRPPLTCRSGACAKLLGAGAACDPMQISCDAVAGLFCNPTSKVCESVKLAKAGEPCGLIGGGYTLCSASGSCKGALTGGTCLATAADGQACDSAGPKCMPPASCIDKVCKLEDPAACK